jgi:fibronectin type 3 domain-containing protein
LFWFPTSGAASYNLYRGTTAGAESATAYQTGLTNSYYTDTSVTNGTTYYYTVKAVSGSTLSAASNESSATPEVAPGAPTSLMATGGILQITLGWTAPTSGANTYNIYRGSSSGQEGGTPIATGVTTPTYVDTDAGLIPGDPYYYEVMAVLNGVEGAVSGESSATVLNPIPAAPTITGAASASGQITLSWTTVGYATSYNVYRGTASGAEGTTPIAASLSSPTYTDTGRTNGTPYYYTVTAVGPGGTSAPSAEAAAVPYAAPTGLTVIPGDVEALLTWSPVAGASTNGGGYVVYQSTSSTGPFMQVGDASATTGTAYLDTGNGTGLTIGATYYYEVAYADSHGNISPMSAAVSTMTVPLNGAWVVSVTPTSTTSAPVYTSAGYSSSSSTYTTVSASAGVSGPASVDTPETGQATSSGTWTASWVPGSAGAVPGLYVLDETSSQNLNDKVTGNGAGDASASIQSGLSVATVASSAAVALPGTPVITYAVDTSTAGIVNFVNNYQIHTLTLTSSGTATTGYAESICNTVHTLHVITPAYFATHYSTGVAIALTFNAPNTGVTANADAPPGTVAGAAWSASGLVGDTFSSYVPGGN